MIRSDPSLSSISNRFRPPVWITFLVWFAFVTGLGVSAFGTTPAITGRSGSPPRNVSSTSVPFRSGKCHPSTPPPWGCIIRTRVDAFPSREVALVEREAHHVAPVLVELRVLAVRLAVDDAVLRPVDARPRRPLLGAELHGGRDRRHVGAVHLVLAVRAR